MPDPERKRPERYWQLAEQPGSNTVVRLSLSVPCLSLSATNWKEKPLGLVFVSVELLSVIGSPPVFEFYNAESLTKILFKLSAFCTKLLCALEAES